MIPARSPRPAASPGFVSALSSWFAGEAALARFRRRQLGRAATVLPPRHAAWRSIVPGFGGSVALAASGLPFQVVADRRYDRTGDRHGLPRALAAGNTILLPQVHQVLPRLMRLMVALRIALLGPLREECSFLFLVEGRSRPGMGLHHDADVDAFWLQLEGARTVTVGPPVPKGSPQDLDDRLAADSGRAGWPPGWWTRDIEPGTLLYLPPHTPHRVICHARSLAVSLTWKLGDAAHRTAAGARRPLRRARVNAAALTAWDVVSGYVERLPRASRDRLWTQVPAVAGPVDPARGRFALWTPGGGEVWLPAAARPLANRLALMPSFPRAAAGAGRDGLALLSELGIMGPRDLPLRIIPDDPSALDGWQFA